MKKSLLPLGLFLLAGMAIAFRPSDPPANVHEYEPVGRPFNLNFTVNKFSAEGVEIALNDPRLKRFFVQFDVEMKRGRPVLTMSGLTDRGRLKGTSDRDKLPGFTFLRRNNGEGDPVMEFSFENQLGTDKAGNQAIRMSYTGVAVPFVQTLIIKDPVTLPPALSRDFDVQGQGRIQFQPGELSLDREIKGFWIPIEMVK